MPRWLRQFTFNKINEYYKKEAEAIETSSKNKGNKSTLIDSSGNIDKNAWKSITPSPKSTTNSKVKYK